MISSSSDSVVGYVTVGGFEVGLVVGFMVGMLIGGLMVGFVHGGR